MALINSVAANTWKNFILDEPEADQVNSNPNLFLVGTKASTPANKRIEELCQNPRTPILAIAPITGKIKIYYGFKNLGGTRTRSQNKIVALEGVGPSATPLAFPEDGILNLCNVRTPLPSELAESTDPEAFRDTSPATGTRRITLKQSGYIILPPFLAESVLNTSDRDPATLALLLRDAVTNFDSAHRDNPAFSPAKPLLDSILPFLWGASNAKIDAIPRIADMDNEELQRWLTHMHNTWLLDSN